MTLRPPRPTRTYTLFPYTTLVRSTGPAHAVVQEAPGDKLSIQRHPVAARADDVARNADHAFDQRHVHVQIMPPRGEQAGRMGCPRYHHVAALEPCPGGEQVKADRGARCCIPEQARRRSEEHTSEL